MHKNQMKGYDVELTSPDIIQISIY